MWYKSGTITVTNGSTTVTGSGTSWITGAGIGEALYAPDGRIYEIANIVSATQLTLGSAYLGTTASGQAYQIVPTQSYIRDLAQQAAQLVADYAGIASNAGTGKFGDGTLGAPGIRFVSDEDTGLFRSASNEVKFVAGGVEQFKYNTSGISFTTAPTFTTPTIFNVNSASTALRITQTGAGNALVVEDAANPDATPFVVGADGDVLVNSDTNVLYSSGLRPKFQLNATGASLMGISRFSANGASNLLAFLKSRGATVGDFTPVVSGDSIGLISFYGADGTSGIQAASITAAVDGTPGTNSMPGRLVFSTTAAGASSPTERMRITSAGTIGFNTNPTAGYNIHTTQPLTGSVNPAGFLLQSPVQPTATGIVSGFYTAISTSSNGGTPYTIGTLNHFFSTQSTKNADSTITNQYGFNAASSLIGATNNYGFYSNIASGTGRWNFYANGTASNYFAGAVSLGSTVGTDSLNIYQDGRNYVNLSRASANDLPPVYATYKSRGTHASKSIVQNGDRVGKHEYYGWDGANFIAAAEIYAEVDGTPGTNDMPGRLVFSTTADGASSPTERMRIDSAGNTTFGSAGTVAGQTVRISKNVTGATASYGLMNRGIVQSDVTNSYRAYHTILETAASAFTLPSASHYAATQGTIGATSAVTNQYGFIAESSLIGATNNYGFYSNIAIGTGRWNFYANGNANNYFGGNVGIGGAPVELLDVYSNGRAFMQITRASANSIQPAFAFRKARGTTSAYTAVVADDWVGDIQFYGHDGTGFIQAAYIGVFVDGTPGTNNMPGRLSFATTLDGSSVPTERLRISAAGTVSLQNSAGLSIARTAVTAPAAADGNVFSGTYTPTLTNISNVDATTAYECQYMRVGNVVTVSGAFDLDATAANTTTNIGISLPIASNFTNTRQCRGTGAINSTTATAIQKGVAFIDADNVNDRATLTCAPEVTTNNTWSFHLTYRVI